MKSKNELMPIVEGILFVYGDEGISLIDLQTVFENEKPSVIKATIEALNEKYTTDEDCAFSIQKFNVDKYRLQTKPSLYPYLAKLELVTSQTKQLSAAAIEVLSIIAYKGPIVKNAIDEIRGVDSTYQLAKLKERALIRVTGRDEQSRAYFYGITDNFFKFFNLSHGLESLPKIEETDLTMGESNPVKPKKEKDLFRSDEPTEWIEEN